MIACYVALMTMYLLLHYGKDLPLWITILLIAIHAISFIQMAVYEERIKDIVRSTIRRFLNTKGE